MNTPTSKDGIRVRSDNSVVRVTIDRPDRHNALGASQVDRLRTVFDEIENDSSARVLVLTGAGTKTFSSGASLDEMTDGTMTGEHFDTLTGRLARLRIPTIAALNGSVYGGGAELALCCDFRVGVQGMQLRVPAARLGVCYPIGGLTRYVQRLGLHAASRILLAAEPLDGDELLRIGFLTALVEPGRLVVSVDELAGRLASLAPLAVQTMKKILIDVAAGSLDPAEAQRSIDECNRSKHLTEGLQAWREKRDPDFR
jgi:enoyl-CoA hydratase/carnithine racemase